jgi:hypothetical protein
VLREKPSKPEVLKNRSPEALDKCHLGKLLVLAHGHMSFGLK